MSDRLLLLFFMVRNSAREVVPKMNVFLLIYRATDDLGTSSGTSISFTVKHGHTRFPEMKNVLFFGGSSVLGTTSFFHSKFIMFSLCFASNRDMLGISEFHHIDIRLIMWMRTGQFLFFFRFF